MNTTRRTKGYGLAVMTLAMFTHVACTQPTADEEDFEGADQDLIHTNALGANALGANALGANALGANALGANALGANSLTTEALNSNEIVTEALTDPNARELLKYVVSCALPADAHIDVDVEGTTYGFDGALGVAPEWGEPGGHCDEECRSWVSGCVIARLDYLQQPIVISLRGKNEGLKSTPQERAQYPHIEATYYGDIFAQPPEVFACLPPGKTSLPRVCGPSLVDCIVEVQGSCESLCGNQRYDGSYPKCREAPTVGRHGKIHKGEKHVGSVTVFLK